MSIYNYLQLQPVDPRDDGTTSDLDEYAADETIDLKNDIDEQTLNESWDKVIQDLQKDPLNFSGK
ncbi:MAG: hypothetical protein ABIP50_04120 [Candidatus Saccharimonadales bacterium]